MVLTSLLALTMMQNGTAMRMMRNPDVHGDLVVFTYSSDLWLSDLHGGYARRLTTHPGTETHAKFSPDGKWIAFTGQYDGGADVYVMPTEGGEPRRLTCEPGGESVLGWTPDGTKVAFASSQESTFTSGLWLVPVSGGAPIRTDIKEVADLSFSPDGKKAAYCRKYSHEFNWRRYRGGTQGRISFWDFEKKTYSELPSGREQSWYPMWVGNTVCYGSDLNDGTVNLYRYDLGTKKSAQLTHFKDGDIRHPSTDGRNVVFERNGLLQTYDLKDGKLETLAPKVLGDMVAMRPRFRRLGDQAQGISLSPSGKRLAVQARGDLYTVPAKNGDTRNLTNTPGPREKSPAWSPDGKTIAYLGDATGEWQIYTVPQMGGTATRVNTNPALRIEGFDWSPDGKLMSVVTPQGAFYVVDPKTGKEELVTKAEYGLGGQDWSPDSKWIAYIEGGKNLFGALYLYNVESKKSTKVTEGYFRDDAVSFDLGGKYLYLVSNRTFQASASEFEFMMSMAPGQQVYVLPLSKDTTDPMRPADDEEPSATDQAEKPKAEAPKAPEKEKEAGIKIDLDGLAQRALPMPFPVGQYSAVIGLNDGVCAISGGTLLKCGLTDDAPATILRGVSLLSFNPKRTTIGYQAMGAVGISDLRPGIDPRGGAVSLTDVASVVDPRAEYRQMYWEAWRYVRDHYYDPKMLGLDWLAIGKHYEKMLDDVADRNDLNIVLGQLVGELGTGHSYVFGGEMTGVPGAPVGMLGADYQVENGFVRFKRVYKGDNYAPEDRGPLGAPGVNVNDGDYLLAVNGVPVNAEQSVSSLLINKVDKDVRLTVNSKPTKEGAREVTVQPVRGEDRLRYATWVEDNRRMVDKLSGGRVGYMHVPNTSMEGVVGFIKGFYSQSDKEAWVIDERYNGGGMIPTFFIDFLRRTFVTAAKETSGRVVGLPSQVLEGPKAMLINSYAGSGGDLFPWYFREAKLGPLIGTRTWGGLVGISGSAPLVDGGGVTAPSFGIFDPKTGEWIAENKGIDPDIEVDDRPDWIAQGKDMPLETAVNYLLKQLKEGNARKPFKVPPFPKVKAAK